MKVSTLSQIVRSLVPALKESGANQKVVTEWEKACDVFDHFRDRSTDEFVAFLTRAKDYELTGAWSNSSDGGTKKLAAELLESVGKPILADKLKAVGKLTVPKLKELCTHLEISPKGKKTDIVDAIRAKFQSSKTPDMVRRLQELRNRADAADADYAAIEADLMALTKPLAVDELVSAAEAFGVILTTTTREQVLEGIRRKVFATKIARDAIAY
ncbi:MAG: hypothetical protein EXS16_01760 [Gemmataceae bacterium]|nr:hypothetical protein [Gemmataceae bacterium]